MHVGEFSSAKHALEGAALAAGTRAKVDSRCEIMGFQLATLFDLDEKMFCRNLHSAREGSLVAHQA